MLLRARAIETGAYVLAAAQGGEHESGRKTYGHSLAVAPWGEIIAEIDGEAPGVVVCDIDPAAVAVHPTTVSAQGPVGTPVQFAGAEPASATLDDRPLGWPFASQFASSQLEYPRVKEARLNLGNRLADTITRYAPRGDIYDRNGTLLATSRLVTEAMA